MTKLLTCAPISLGILLGVPQLLIPCLTCAGVGASSVAADGVGATSSSTNRALINVCTGTSKEDTVYDMRNLCQDFQATVHRAKAHYMLRNRYVLSWKY
jgi:hypothetical protein